MKLKKSTKEQAKKYRDTYEKLFNELPDNIEESLMFYYKQRVLKIYDESCS